MPLPTPESEFDVKLLTDVQTHGWHVMYVGSKDQLPPWAYTIGLFHNYRHPEFVVFGLGRNVAHPLLNILGNAVKDGGRVIVGHERNDLLEGVPCTFREVSRVWYWPILGFARWFYAGDEFPTLQCIWPDKLDRWPWDPAFAPEWIAHQPLLFEQEPQAARMEALLDSLTRGGDAN